MPRALTQAQRDAITAAREEGATQTEAALRLGISERTVRNHWWAALDAALEAEANGTAPADEQRAPSLTGTGLGASALGIASVAAIRGAARALSVDASEFDWGRVARIVGAVAALALAAWLAWRWRHRQTPALPPTPEVKR